MSRVVVQFGRIPCAQSGRLQAFAGMLRLHRSGHRLGMQSLQANQVLSRHSKNKESVGLLPASQLHFPLQSDHLLTAETQLFSFPYLLAERCVRMPRPAPVNCDGLDQGVLCHVRHGSCRRSGSDACGLAAIGIEDWQPQGALQPLWRNRQAPDPGV